MDRVQRGDVPFSADSLSRISTPGSISSFDELPCLPPPRCRILPNNSLARSISSSPEHDAVSIRGDRLQLRAPESVPQILIGELLVGSRELWPQERIDRPA